MRVQLDSMPEEMDLLMRQQIRLQVCTGGGRGGGASLRGTSELLIRRWLVMVDDGDDD